MRRSSLPDSLSARPTRVTAWQLQVDLPLDHMELAAACLDLPASVRPAWLDAQLVTKRVGMLIAVLWRLRRVSLPVLAMCHRLIGLGAVSNTGMQQLLDLVQVSCHVNGLRFFQRIRMASNG